MSAQSAFVCQLCDQKNVQWKCEECGIFICSTCKERVHPRLKSSEKHKIVSIKDVWKNKEPWYHGKMTRLEAESLLEKYKDMGDGAFLVRESESVIGNYTTSFLMNGEPIHLRIPTKEQSGQLMYETEGELFESLYASIECLKHGTHILVIDVSKTKFTLTIPIPKEAKRC